MVGGGGGVGTAEKGKSEKELVVHWWERRGDEVNWKGKRQRDGQENKKCVFPFVDNWAGLIGAACRGRRLIYVRQTKSETAHCSWGVAFGHTRNQESSSSCTFHIFSSQTNSCYPQIHETAITHIHLQ